MDFRKREKVDHPIEITDGHNYRWTQFLIINRHILTFFWGAAGQNSPMQYGS